MFVGYRFMLVVGGWLSLNEALLAGCCLLLFVVHRCVLFVVHWLVFVLSVGCCLLVVV